MALCRVCTGVPALLVVALLPGCKSIEVPKVPGVTPYRMVIQQGNFISQEMVSQLKPGMSKEQVRFVLGTPLVTDIFHADRWDYVFYREAANGKREQRNLSVVFEKDKLARVLGDLLPADGTAPKASGFEPLVKPEAKPETKPAAAAKPPAKPAAAEAAPAAVSPAAAEAAKPVATGQNWATASEQLETQPAAAPAAKDEEQKPAEEKKEPGFLDRLREKIGL
jgi:outer membrane protein assembly factor BamE